MLENYEALQDSLIAGQSHNVKNLVSALLDKGIVPMEIISRGLIAGMSIVGQKMKSGEMYIPEVLASAHAMSEGMGIIPLFCLWFFSRFT